MTEEKTMESMKAMLNEHSETIRKLKDVLTTRENELRSCVNELCFRCGNYREDNMACVWCRWDAIRNGDGG